MDDEVLDNPEGWVARHIRRYVETDGRSGHKWRDKDSLLLTTRGRRSGRLRRTALFYGRDGDRYVLVASGGGEPTPPSWYLNLVAHPAVVVQVRADTFAAVARTAGEDERPPLWRMMVSIHPRYETYQARTGKELPVVILEPRTPRAPG
jgi:deazaflavin-dependent oxidoreductase (nitroreductase family)